MSNVAAKASDVGSGFNVRSLVLTCPEDAQRELERIGADQPGIARMLPKLQTIALLVPAVRPPAANILKQEMLSLGGDAAVARGTVACSVEKTDVMLIGNRRQLKSLCEKLVYQPFGLPGLAAVILDHLEKQSENRFWHIRQGRLSLERPLVMGILNVTPDSFSDGGRFIDPAKAVDQALQMENDGADLIDIGGESARPGSAPVSSGDEKRRIIPVIERLAGKIRIPLSVDTWKSDVAKAAVDAGASIVNDISGFLFDSEMPGIVSAAGAGVVLMHTSGPPQTMQQNTGYTDLMGEISASLAWSASLAVSAGISKEAIALDPGIGFGKDLPSNLEILRRLGELASLGYPLLVGTSRKSFIGRILGRELPEDRISGTAATVALAVVKGASIIRVHDVKAMKDVADMASAIVKPSDAGKGA